MVRAILPVLGSFEAEVILADALISSLCILATLGQSLRDDTSLRNDICQHPHFLQQFFIWSSYVPLMGSAIKRPQNSSLKMPSTLNKARQCLIHATAWRTTSPHPLTPNFISNQIPFPVLFFTGRSATCLRCRFHKVAQQIASVHNCPIPSRSCICVLLNAVIEANIDLWGQDSIYKHFEFVRHENWRTGGFTTDAVVAVWMPGPRCTHLAFHQP